MILYQLMFFLWFCKDENSLLAILIATSRYYYLSNMSGKLSGNLCNTIVTAILNQALAYLHLEWYNLYCAFKNGSYQN